LTSKSNPITNKAHKHQEIKHELQEMIPYKANTNNYKVITRIYNFFFEFKITRIYIYIFFLGEKQEFIT